MDWADLFYKFSQAHNWTPRQVLYEVTLSQISVIWTGERQQEGSGESAGEVTLPAMDRASRIEMLNRTLAKKGLPLVQA